MQGKTTTARTYAGVTSLLNLVAGIPAHPLFLVDAAFGNEHRMTHTTTGDSFCATEVEALLDNGNGISCRTKDGEVHELFTYKEGAEDAGVSNKKILAELGKALNAIVSPEAADDFRSAIALLWEGDLPA